MRVQHGCSSAKIARRPLFWHADTFSFESSSAPDSPLVASMAYQDFDMSQWYNDPVQRGRPGLPLLHRLEPQPAI
ncbi:hypothetical protein B0T14DRAFT_511799 [Immersiella caudata]|uniref:Uncharacterized protein n=1 Tax=Immersiella caudata TaxID=314043 RepID=A0AA39X4G7_9PEZI|nr:hypothetical protein B0T14DRAFT_511799 [Immersiella caudata]